MDRHTLVNWLMCVFYVKCMFGGGCVKVFAYKIKYMAAAAVAAVAVLIGSMLLAYTDGWLDG